MAGVAQWIERWPVNEKVAGLIPSPHAHLPGVEGQVPS